MKGNDPDKQYLADGMMDAILLHLSKIKDLRVMSRTSVEKYRKTDKTLNVIGKELEVSYLLEGSFQKFGDNARLIVQLIKTGKEGHVWANDYDRNWSDIFKVQSEVAQKVADELNAAITPEEKRLINKIPTTNLTAYDFYQQGREEYTKWQNKWINGDTTALQKAEDFYHKALKYDSKFAPAYSGLAEVYWDKHSGKEKEYFSRNYMDSVLILTNIALSFDDQLFEAYTLRGRYYDEIGKPEQAIEEYDKAIKLNPNNWRAYKVKADHSPDFLNNIKYYHKAVSLNHGPELPGLLVDIGWAYLNAGFPGNARQYFQDVLKLDGDSLSYYSELANVEEPMQGYSNKAIIEYWKKAYAIDSTNEGILFSLGQEYEFLGQNKESLKYWEKYLEMIKASGRINVAGMGRIGYAYWQNGYKKEAEYYFNEQIKYCNKSIELKRSYGGQILYAYYDLAGIYAFKGEKDKAYKNLRIFNQFQRMPLWTIRLIKTDPLFNSIRNEPEFQQIAKDIEAKIDAKYQAEHERVRKWLEEQGKL